MADLNNAKHDRFGKLTEKVFNNITLTPEEAVHHKELFTQLGGTLDANGAMWVCKETWQPLPPGYSCPDNPPPGCTCFQATHPGD